jgi:nucleotide-binding universal stress UspA family protein
MKILLAADGSSYTRAAARYLARHAKSLGQPLAVHILHVCPPIPYPGAAAVAGRKAIDGYQRDESLKALLVAEKELDKAGVAFSSSWSVGEAAEQIALCARETKADLIVTGSRGHSALANLALGSVTTRLLATAATPVLVVTRDAARADSKPHAAKQPTAVT